MSSFGFRTLEDLSADGGCYSVHHTIYPCFIAPIQFTSFCDYNDKPTGPKTLPNPLLGASSEPRIIRFYNPGSSVIDFRRPNLGHVRQSGSGHSTH